MAKHKELQHTATIRLPIELHHWVLEIAKESKSSKSYIYRQAIWHYKNHFIFAK